ncbi:MAG TPA: cytochrome-c oxidase, cbb3-type subunit III [Rhizobiaceae bacterium]|nr:cytochrome-c oxidase, cbb3-type subunit III [Rhizobiaceae bacterium]
MADHKHVDEVSGVETTGHEWDGIRELNNPLPRWWLWTFYATIVWALAYTIWYPAWPLISSATTGLSGWSSRADLRASLADAKAAQTDRLAQLEQMEVADILANDDLRTFAAAGGKAAFKVNCVQCHGSGAQGAPGYPNLNDDDWIWGGSIDAIHQTIAYGVRQNNDETRIAEMPAFGRDELLDRSQIDQVAWYVMKLSGQEADAAKAETGATVYAENCAACHGDAGEGLPETGAPRLADQLWLYGGTHADIVAQLSNPKHGVMPAWGERLGPVAVKQLAVYVHGLSGGQ